MRGPWTLPVVMDSLAGSPGGSDFPSIFSLNEKRLHFPCNDPSLCPVTPMLLLWARRSPRGFQWGSGRLSGELLNTNGRPCPGSWLALPGAGLVSIVMLPRVSPGEPGVTSSALGKLTLAGPGGPMQRITCHVRAAAWVPGTGRCVGSRPGC